MADLPDNETRLASVEARLQELEDDRAIREVLSRYGFNADQGRVEAWAGLFTENGALDVAGLKYLDGGDAPSQEDAIVRPEGHEALRKFILDPRHKILEEATLHVMDSNLVTRISGDVATAESYNLTLVRKGAETSLFNASINRWTLVRVAGRWLIKECFRRRPGAPGYDRVLVTRE